MKTCEMRFRGFGISLSQDLGCQNPKPHVTAAPPCTVQTASQVVNGLESPALFLYERTWGVGLNMGRWEGKVLWEQLWFPENWNSGHVTFHHKITVFWYKLPPRCLQFRTACFPPSAERRWNRKPGFLHIMYNSNHKKTSIGLHPAGLQAL